MSRTKRALKYLLLIAVVYASFNIFLSGAGFFLRSKYPLVVVEGISMEPTYYGGDLLFVKEVANKSTINYPDVIVFYEPISRSKLIVHRVAERIVLNTYVEFITKGDNNHTPDRWTVHESDIIGVVVARVPAIGSIVLTMQSPAGKVFTAGLLIVIVGINIFYDKEGEGEGGSGKNSFIKE